MTISGTHFRLLAAFVFAGKFCLSLSLGGFLRFQLLPRWKSDDRNGRPIDDIVSFRFEDGVQDDALRDVHNYFMTMALEEAEYSKTLGEVPVGAVVVQRVGLLHEKYMIDMSNKRVESSALPCNGEEIVSYLVLARAGNRVETDSDASAHAELLALRKAAKRNTNWRLGENVTLYSTLEPCPMCLSAIQAFRLGSLVYGAPDLRLGAVETHIRMLEDYRHPFHNLTSVVKGVESEKCAELLRDFFRQRREERKQKID